MNEQSISFGNPYLSTGSSSVTHIANVPDNDMADITRLLELWRNKYPRNLLRSAFYDAKQRFNNLGISIPNIVAQKAGVVVGWPQKSVRALADKSVFEGFETAAGADNHGIDEIMRMNELETDMSEAVISCYKHSCSFLTIDYDPDDNERILITPRSADWSAALWDNERRRIKAALTITDSAGNVVFEGTAATYDDFLFPANGDYKAELTVWRLPENMLATQFEGGSTGELRQDVRLEKPARPTGWYYYSFRFTLQASAEVELSAERMEQGGTVAAAFTGMVGETAPTVETDLGNVQAVRLGSGWRAYIPAAYNAAAGAHEVTFTVGGETVVKNITVIPKDFGTVEVEAEPEASEAANTEFRNAVWPLYEQPAREKLWSGGFACPAENYMTLVDFGQTKVTGGKQGSKSNSTKLYTIPGDPCRAPANGVVVLARNLALTGNTVVIDHGCGMRSYLYGLDALSVSEGQSVERGQAVGALGEDLTMDFKLGSKSINPWLLFQTSGGLFWKENG